MACQQLNEQGLPENYPFQPDWEITPRQVKAMRDDQVDFFFLDCRQAHEHALVAIDGATLLPMQELGPRLSELEGHRDQPVVVFCHHGGRSMRVTQVLRQNGFEDVRSMAGGIDLWAVDIDPSLKRY